MLSPEDLAWLKANYPDLHYDPQENLIEGELAFRMFYMPSHENEYIINPDASFEGIDRTIIEDVYEIEIHFMNEQILPKVRELGGRIVDSQRKWDVQSLQDLHVFRDGSLCLCVPIEIELRLSDGFNLKDFFERLLIPYFYYQSYFEQYGQEPWTGYSHGDLGILESFQNRLSDDKSATLEIIKKYQNALSDEVQKMIGKRKTLKGHHKCLCGSGKKFRKCHRKALFGYNGLRRAYGINFPT